MIRPFSKPLFNTSTPDYRQLLDNLTTAVVLVDASFEILHINSASESLLEISAQQMTGSPFSDYFHESAQSLERMKAALEEDAQYTKRKAKWKLHNGKYITVDYTVTPLQGQKQLLLEIEPLDRLLRISRDEALLASQETTKNLIRGLAHEVKNPLGGIRGAAQLLERELDNKELQEYTRIIMAESDRLRNLVDRMLGPRNMVQFTDTNIHEVLERVIAVINAETAGTILLKRNYDPSIPDIQGDVELLIQAILNIVRNAVQALSEETSNSSPQITLSTRVIRQFTIGRCHHPLVANITISDNGPGIPPDILKDIFYPMISGRAEGTGLGLAISQQLITQHSGLIECSSEPRKTDFSIYIPLYIPVDT